MKALVPLLQRAVTCPSYSGSGLKSRRAPGMKALVQVLHRAATCSFCSGCALKSHRARGIGRPAFRMQASMDIQRSWSGFRCSRVVMCDEEDE